MENPQKCPPEIYNIMQNCWLEDRDNRPEFAQISILIGKILEQRASQVSPFSPAEWTGEIIVGFMVKAPNLA